MSYEEIVPSVLCINTGVKEEGNEAAEEEGPGAQNSAAYDYIEIWILQCKWSGSGGWVDYTTTAKE